MSLFVESPPLRVKICGITRPEDAEVAIHAGADALGFNFFPGSKRYVELAVTRSWISDLAGCADRVAVVVNAEASLLGALRDSGCFEAIQFHGDESPEVCAGAGFTRWIRAARVRNGTTLTEVLRYETPFLLLDAWSGSAYGGTGERLDWDEVGGFVEAQPLRRVVLAGGLTPDNVNEAVRAARPHGVDVASGVESRPGIKDAARVREFVNQARGG